MRYRKKPVVIEAFKWTIDEVPDWWKELKGVTIDVSTGSAFIPTLEGTMEARVGDFIIKGIKGEIYPCKPDIFQNSYEKAESEQGQDELWNEFEKDVYGKDWSEIKKKYQISKI